MPGSLYVVSTPIGNLDDITLRALNTLKSVALIAAEDTRRTAILLRHFGITTPTTSLHEHNERQKVPHLLQKLADGLDIALVSDAGTPLVADPGQRLVAAASAKAIRVVPIPGASAVLSALVASGLAADTFVFGGFAPARSIDRKKWLRSFRDDRRPIVFFESPHRIIKTLADISSQLVERPIIIAREMTKLHEEVIRTTVAGAKDVSVLEKGEFTIILGPVTEDEVPRDVVDEHQVEAFFVHLTNSNGVSRRAALVETADRFGLSPNQVYALLERVKSASTP